MASKYEGFLGPNSVPAFSPSVDQLTSAFVQLPPGKIFRAGTRFIQQGETPTSVKLVRSGIVKIVHTNSAGNIITLGLRSEGWWMSAALAITQVMSLATVISVTEASVTSLSVDAFREAITRDEVLNTHFISTLCRDQLMMQQYIIMQAEDAATRLRSLYAESKTSGWNTANPTSVLRQSEIASLLAITPEHLSRIKTKSIEK